MERKFNPVLNKLTKLAKQHKNQQKKVPNFKRIVKIIRLECTKLDIVRKIIHWWDYGKLIERCRYEPKIGHSRATSKSNIKNCSKNITGFKRCIGKKRNGQLIFVDKHNKIIEI